MTRTAQDVERIRRHSPHLEKVTILYSTYSLAWSAEIRLFQESYARFHSVIVDHRALEYLKVGEMVNRKLRQTTTEG